MEANDQSQARSAARSVLVRAKRTDSDVRGRCLATLVGDHPSEWEVVVLTHDAMPGAIVDEWERQVGVDPERLGVLAVGTSMRSASGGAVSATGADRNVVRGVNTVAQALQVLSEWVTPTCPTAVFVDLPTEGADFDRSDVLGVVDDVTDIVAAVGGDVAIRIDPACTPPATVALLATVVDDVLDVPPPHAVRGDASARTSPPDAVTTIPTATVLELLANDRRRLVCHSLRQVDQPLSVTQLAERIVEFEHRGDRPIPESTFERTYADLYHAQLGKLDEAGVIAFDAEARTASATPDLAALEPYLTLTAATDLEA